MFSADQFGFTDFTTEERNNKNIKASRRHTRSRDFNLQQSTVNCVFAHSQAKRSQQTFCIILERQSKKKKIHKIS